MRGQAETFARGAGKAKGMERTREREGGRKKDGDGSDWIGVFVQGEGGNVWWRLCVAKYSFE